MSAQGCCVLCAERQEVLGAECQWLCVCRVPRVVCAEHQGGCLKSVKGCVCKVPRGVPQCVQNANDCVFAECQGDLGLIHAAPGGPAALAWLLLRLLARHCIVVGSLTVTISSAQAVWWLSPYIHQHHRVTVGRAPRSGLRGALDTAAGQSRAAALIKVWSQPMWPLTVAVVLVGCLPCDWRARL